MPIFSASRSYGKTDMPALPIQNTDSKWINALVPQCSSPFLEFAIFAADAKDFL